MKIFFNPINFNEHDRNEIIGVLKKIKLEWSCSQKESDIIIVNSSHLFSASSRRFNENTVKSSAFLRAVFKDMLGLYQKIGYGSPILRFVIALVTDVGENIDRETIRGLFDIFTGKLVSANTFKNTLYKLRNKNYLVEERLDFFDLDFINHDALVLPDYRLNKLMPKETKEDPKMFVPFGTEKDEAVLEHILLSLSNMQANIDEIKQQMDSNNFLISNVDSDVQVIKTNLEGNVMGSIFNTVQEIRKKMDIKPIDSTKVLDILVDIGKSTLTSLDTIMAVSNSTINAFTAINEKLDKPKSNTAIVPSEKIEVDDDLFSELNSKLDKILSMELPTLDKITDMWNKHNVGLVELQSFIGLAKTFTVEQALKMKKLAEMVILKD